MGASSDRLLKWKSRDVYPRLKSVRKLRYENCSVERAFTLGWLNFSVTPTSDGDGRCRGIVKYESRSASSQRNRDNQTLLSTIALCKSQKQ